VPATALTSDDARLLLSKVRRDRILEPRFRRRAQRLLLHVDQPTLVLARLQRAAGEALPDLPRRAPTTDLARAVTADTFLRYHCRADFRDAFLSVDDFIAFMAAQPDKRSVLRSALSSNASIFPWSRSWLAEYAPLIGLSGHDASLVLELDKEPPLVLFVFRLGDMTRNDVTVRPPCSLDSVIAPNLQWRETGLVSGVPEYVDGDVPLAALTELEWRP
jgi:hypothetical protein